MKEQESQPDGISIQQLKTTELEQLMSKVLREMRCRDSDHVKGDVITGTHSLRKLRISGELTERQDKKGDAPGPINRP